MSRIGPITRTAASRAAATPTGALRFVAFSAYLTIAFVVLEQLDRTGFVAAMAVFSTGVLLAALTLHLRLVARGRRADGAEADRNRLPRVSRQVLVVCALLSAVALLAGQPGDQHPALALAVTGLIAGVVSVVASRSPGHA